MKTGKILLLCGTGCLVAAFGAWMWLASRDSNVHRGAFASQTDDTSEYNEEACIPEIGETPQYTGRKTGPMTIGRFPGEVVYDEEKDFYFLELRGARLPFKSSPLEAQSIRLEAEGKTDLEKNTSLLYTIMGKGVQNATVLINPDEEDEVMPAAEDIARYIQIANPRKFSGIAYTKEGGQMERSVRRGSQIRTLDDATPETSIIYLKGPKGGANKTGVFVAGKGQVIVEGETYEDLYKAADLICITLLKMLCGSEDCPDAAACATGGNCGCG